MNKTIFVIFFLLFSLLLLSFSFLLYQFNKPLSNSQTFQTFEIKKGESFREIAQRLEERGLISSAKYFDFYVIFKGIASKLKAGVYQLSPSLSLKEIALKIYQGPFVEEISVTIPEGYNIYQIDNLLAKKGVINKGDLVKFQPSGALINRFTFLAQKPKEVNLEGFLFPDTYRFFVTSNKNIEPVIEKFLVNFEKHLNSGLMQKIEKEGWSVYDVLILASIIEKEVSDKADKPVVADILIRRLRESFPLQVDASVVYAKMLNNGISWQEALPLTENDYKINSLYNTYKYKGLLPTPICNPGMDSILAVVYPQKNNYWYYLTDPQTKKTIFSKTFLEHKKNKFKYLK